MAPMITILFLSTVKGKRKSYGGAVYTESILNALKGVDEYVEVKELYFEKHANKIFRKMRGLFAFIRSVVTGEPLRSTYFKSVRFANMVRSEINTTDYDIIIIEHAELLWVLDLIEAKREIKVIHLSQNIEHILYSQYIAKYKKMPLLVKYFAHDAVRFMQYEIDGVRRSGHVITISEDDSMYWKKTIAELDVKVVNPFFEYRRNERINKYRVEDRVNLGFLGNLNWWPNRDAIDWFIQNVFTEISARITLHLFGIKSEEYDNPGKRIIGHGYVDNLNDVWRTVDIMINPIISGAGVNVKVAEAIYNKMPMICTKEALKGLNLWPDTSIRVMDNAYQWQELLNNNKSQLEELMNCSVFVNADRFCHNEHIKEMRGYLNAVMLSNSKQGG